MTQQTTKDFNHIIGSLNTEFHEYLRNNPKALDGMHFSAASDEMFAYENNPMPVFMGPEFKSRLSTAATKIPHLVLKLLKHNISQNAQNVADFYHQPKQNLLRSIKQNIASQLLCRADLICSENRLSILELNIGSNLGGWETRFFHQKYQKVAPLSDFYQRHQSQLCFKDTLHGLISNLIRAIENLQRPSGQAINFALLFEGAPLPPLIEQYWQSILQSIAQMNGVECHFQFIYQMHQLRLNNQRVICNNRVIDCFMMLSYDIGKPLQLPMPLLEAFYAGNLVLPENPINMIIGDKRNLTLLRHSKDSGLFNAQEKQWIEDFIPWSCNSNIKDVEYQGQNYTFAAFMLEFKNQLVIKAGKGFQGNDVFIGNQTDAQQWQLLIEQCQKNPNFIIQQYLAPGTINGISKHQLVPFNAVWGAFSFASQYWGCWVRAMEKSVDTGIINSSKGAQEMMVYEQS